MAPLPSGLLGADADELSENSDIPRLEMYMALVLVGVSLFFPEAGYKGVLFSSCLSLSLWWHSAFQDLTLR